MNIQAHTGHYYWWDQVHCGSPTRL